MRNLKVSNFLLIIVSLFLFFGAIIMVVACGEEDNQSSIKSEDKSLTVTKPAQPTTPTVETVENPSEPELTALGATREAWDANHDAAPGFTEGSAYLPLEGGQPKYYTVMDSKGIIMDYSMNLSSGPDIDTAKLLVAAELPSDATILEGKTSERCLLADIQSATLDSLFGEQVPIVVFYSGPDAYTPSRIEYVTFSSRLANMEKTC